MRCWILNKDLNTYIHMCASEGYKPVILEQNEEKEQSRVDMSAHSATMWNMMGYWYELG